MPRGNMALCRRQTFNEPDSVTVKPKAELLQHKEIYAEFS